MKLRYTRKAASELSGVLAYIDERSPQGARRVKASIEATTDLMLQHPYCGQLTSKGRLRRVVIYPFPYLIFYRVAKNDIVIHGVRHGARRPSSMPA